jgi:ferritin
MRPNLNFLAAYFKRDGVALHGFAKYMSKQSDEEREHAQKFVDYVNRRGGRVVLEQIAKPITEIESPLKALEAVLALEKDVTTKIEQLYEVSKYRVFKRARSRGDFLRSQFLRSHETHPYLPVFTKHLLLISIFMIAL